MGLVLLTRGRWERGKEQDSPELCHHSPRLHAASPGTGEPKGDCGHSSLHVPLVLGMGQRWGTASHPTASLVIPCINAIKTLPGSKERAASGCSAPP